MCAFVVFVAFSAVSFFFCKVNNLRTLTIYCHHMLAQKEGLLQSDWPYISGWASLDRIIFLYHFPIKHEFDFISL